MCVHVDRMGPSRPPCQRLASAAPVDSRAQIKNVTSPAQLRLMTGSRATPRFCQLVMTCSKRKRTKGCDLRRTNACHRVCCTLGLTHAQPRKKKRPIHGSWLAHHAPRLRSDHTNPTLFSAHWRWRGVSRLIGPRRGIRKLGKDLIRPAGPEIQDRPAGNFRRPRASHMRSSVELQNVVVSII